MKKDFVRIQVGGKKYRWYYKKFMKRVLKGVAMFAAGLAVAYFMLDATLKAWDVEFERQERLVEEHLRHIEENSFDPEVYGVYYKERGDK